MLGSITDEDRTFVETWESEWMNTLDSLETPCRGCATRRWPRPTRRPWPGSSRSTRG